MSTKEFIPTFVWQCPHPIWGNGMGPTVVAVSPAQSLQLGHWATAAVVSLAVSSALIDFFVHFGFIF